MAILSDEFYYQPIRIDTINTRVYADLLAKEGDANGRGLLVTLTENGLMKDTTGITLILKWEHTSVGNQGLDNFEAVDPSKGLYKITYPTEMLNRGKVRAFIQIIDSGKLAGIRNIEITVDRGVGDDTAIASSDSFTALAQALIDVNNLESTYAPELLSVKQQLAEAEQQLIVAETEIAVERARVDSFTTLASGSTTGDAELIDGRVGADAVTYPNIGGAIRAQIAAIKDDLTYKADKDQTILAKVTVNKDNQLLDLTTIEENKFFDANGTTQYNANYAVSALIPVERGHRIYFYRYDNHADINAVWGFQGFDKKGNFVKQVQLASVTNYYDNTDCDTIRIAFDMSMLSLLCVEQDAQTITSYVPHVPTTYVFDESVFLANNPLYGKKLITLGDSITAGAGVTDKTKTWGNLIAKRNNMEYLNAGISGSTMGVAVDLSETNPSYASGRHLAINGYDYATIWFGWNDYNFCSLGTADGTDVAKTLVAYRKTLEYIIGNFVETKVGVIIPYLWSYNTDPQDHTIMQMLNGIKAVCDLCGVPYLDINKFNFLPSWGSDYPNNDQYYIKWNQRQTVFTADTLHPNVAGNAYISTIIENFLRSL